MKKTIKIVILFLLFLFVAAIIKYNFFTDNDTKFYKDGWTAYENKQYDLTIFYLNHIDKQKYPDISAPLGFSYMEKKDYPNAISNLQEAVNKNIGKNEGYQDKILNSLGLCYLFIGEFDKAKIYLDQAQNSGNPDAGKNLKILDSLELNQTKY